MAKDHLLGVTLIISEEVLGKYEVKFGESNYVKSVRIRIYSGPHFPAIGLNMETYFVSLRIQSEYGEMRTRITPSTLFTQ